MPQSHYSAEVREHAIALVCESRLSVNQAAQKVGCSATSLHNWLKQHQKMTIHKKSTTDKSTFVPVTIIDSTNQSVEITTPTGITIRLANASPTYLAELLLALAPC